MSAPTHNQPEFSVSEISGALKRVVEDNFGYVRVRGELSGFKRAASGHLYMDLKDDKAVIAAVCWKGKASGLSFKPEDGLEVIVTGKVTTYPGSSKYQIIIDRMEPAGVGALMALLEKRKKALADEGLFAPERKQKLPFMPQTIGVVTSPTGAVIRDILHRLSDRFPVHVLVWPVRVQGDGAAEEIVSAIEGFNVLAPHPNPLPKGEGTCLTSPFGRGRNDGDVSGEGQISRPELIIVARGGGSIEDLWCFNEEIVVRAGAASAIPVISAVGHETDTTLIDYVADQRAPTPTAAAELAVPVRREWMLGITEWHNRIQYALHQLISQQAEKVEHLARAIPSPQQMLAHQSQRLDDWSERLGRALPQHVQQSQQQLLHCTTRLKGEMLLRRLLQHKEPLRYADEQLQRMVQARLERAEERLKLPASLLESLNYKQVLKRGFAMVQTPKGEVVQSAAAARKETSLKLVFADDALTVRPDKAPANRNTNAPVSKPKQTSLFD